MTIAEWYDPREKEPEDGQLVLVALENCILEKQPVIARYKVDSISGFKIVDSNIKWAYSNLFETHDDFLKYGKPNDEIWVRAWAELPPLPKEEEIIQLS